MLWLIVLAAPVAVYAALSAGGTDAWHRYGIEHVTPSFSDMRNITTAVDCRRLGYDPLLENPCDPYTRPVNYPRAWVGLFSLLGFEERHTVPLAAVAIAAFAVAVAAVARPRTFGDAALWLALLCAPPLLLAVERGNIDIVVFALLVAAVACHRRPRLLVLGWVAWVLAGVAKLFPLFSAPAFLLPHGVRNRRTGLVAVGVLLTSFVATRRDIEAINSVVPQGVRVSYGARVVFAHLADDVVRPEHRLWGAALAVVLVAAVVVLVRSARSDVATSHLTAFRVGACIYGSTFVLGSNWEYRLIFLLLAVPQLAEWRRSGDVGLRAVAIGTCVLMVAVFWLGHGASRADELVDDVCSWLLLLSLAGLARHTIALHPSGVPPRVPKQAPVDAGVREQLAVT